MAELVFVLVLIVFVLSWLLTQQPRPRRAFQPSGEPRASLPRILQPVDSKTRKRLLRLVNGDKRIAKRLLNHARATNPNRSEQWCWEKVIYDLERDRRV